MDVNNIMRKLPKMEKLLEDPRINSFIDEFGRDNIVNVLRHSTEKIRRDLLNSINNKKILNVSEEKLKAKVLELAIESLSFSPYMFKRVVNATGIILHTNLGRSPLPQNALARITDVCSGFSNLEYDISSGERGERYDLIRELLCELTGAEDALVVNNNAAAVLLCLSALAFGKEVVISRGELVEIGGSFRIPDIMIQSGTQLVEVGTTNKTYISDYKRAINENTALLLKVHTSNYKIVGFSANVDNRELCDLAKMYDLPVMEDLGSGVLIDLKPYGFPDEPTVRESVQSGVDIVTFSGDKLLGGPQAGIIVGKRKFIEIVKRHPLTRAVRVDKMTLAALEGVLMLYSKQKSDEIPTLNMLTKTMESIESDALILAQGLKDCIDNKGIVEIVNEVSQVGGGSYPDHDIPTKAVAISLISISTEELSQRLRTAEIPIIGRIKDDKLILDLRTMSKEDINITIEMVESLI